MTEAKPPFSCNKCKGRWGGQRTAHCMGCCVTFSGITTFDKHQKSGKCQTPEETGLVLTDRNYTCWGVESSGEEWWKDA